jgi:hypothetical protein
MQTNKCYLCDLKLRYSYYWLKLSDNSEKVKICNACKNSETFACDYCHFCHLKKSNTPVPTNDFGNIACANCYDRHFCPCNECGKMTRVNYYKVDEKTHCKECFDKYFFCCHNCGRNYSLDDCNYYNDRYYCNNCYDNVSNRASFSENKRDYSNEVITSPVVGDIVKSNFTFGIELECIISNTNLAQALKKLPATLGITPDGSVSDGGEFITPPLQNKQGENYLIDVCKTLQDNKADINSSCGTHCHIAIPESYKSPKILQAIMLSYVAFEPVLLSMLPPQRRGNTYAVPVSKKYTLEDIAKIKTVASLDKIWYKSTNKKQRDYRKTNKYDGSRYCGLNIHALLYNGKTLEIRYHSGTVNAEKILHWVAVNTCLINLATNKQFVADIQTSGNKLKTFFDYSKDDLTTATKEYVISRIAKFKKHNNKTNICVE